MTEEIFFEEIANEIKRIQLEMEFVENEYNNYIRELQYIHNGAKEFNYIRRSRKYYPYDMEALKEKHKDKITKGIKARF